MPVLVRQVRIHQLQRLAAAVRVVRPDPAGVRIKRVADPEGPIAFVGVVHAIDTFAGRIIEVEIVVDVAEVAKPVAQHVGHRGILGPERGEIACDDQEPARAQRVVGKIKLDPAVQPPAGEANGVGALVEQLDVFLRGQLRGGMIHDLVDDDVGLRRVGVEHIVPRAAGERIDAMVAFQEALAVELGGAGACGVGRG